MYNVCTCDTELLFVSLVCVYKERLRISCQQLTNQITLLKVKRLNDLITELHCTLSCMYMYVHVH